MLALDFKLTSGQVRALLRVWHGRAFKPETSNNPALIALSGQRDSFLVAAHALMRKGLITHTHHYLPNGHHDETKDQWQTTKQGEAIAEMIVSQAQLVMAVDASRRERLAKEKQKGKKLTNTRGDV